MPNYIGKAPGNKSEIYGMADIKKVGFQQYKPANHQSDFNGGGNNLQNVAPMHPIVTKVMKRVHGLDAFGTNNTTKRPIKTTGGK